MRLYFLIALAGLLGAGCAEQADSLAMSEGPDASPPVVSSSSAPSTSVTASPAQSLSEGPDASPPVVSSSVAPSTSTSSAAPVRGSFDAGYGVLADAEGVTVFYPAAMVEMVGFHEAGHDGSKQMTAMVDAPATTMETRERDTGSRTAADIVVAPLTEIRSPVTGTVIRGGSYTLYCEHTDDFVVIEPDEQPGWEVKMFHFDGLQLTVGDRVEAGVTVVAPRAAVLPFESQVDELSFEPSWPHVHVEVIDPAIPDRPSAGGGC